MSKKYEHQISRLKDHKHDKEGKHQQKKFKPYSRKNKLGKLKKEEKEIREKTDKSEYTWLQVDNNTERFTRIYERTYKTHISYLLISALNFQKKGKKVLSQLYLGAIWFFYLSEFIQQKISKIPETIFYPYRRQSTHP